MRDFAMPSPISTNAAQDHDTQDGAKTEPKTTGATPRPATPSPKGGRGQKDKVTHFLLAAPKIPDANDPTKPIGVAHLEPHPSPATISERTNGNAQSMEINPPAASIPPQPATGTPQEELIDGGQFWCDRHMASAPVDNRFTDPLICEIVETWRSRQDMVRAQSKLTLQIKSICRRFCAGDKKEADNLYSAIEKGAEHPAAMSASMACAALFMARQPLEQARKGYEKHLTKLGKQLPIAHMADQIKGVGHLALAKIVGECGDLSAYKSVAAVWKRAGLAVVNGERQRRKSDAELALLHGYSPERRSTFWNIAAALLKAQGKDETAGPYRQYYDAEKARQTEKECTKAQAHNRAMRHMTKKLLKDLVIEWRRIAAE